MPFTRESQTRTTPDRRHSTDVVESPTPPLSRSSSVTSTTSNISHKSEPSWVTTLDGSGQGRTGSIVSTSTAGSDASQKSSGFKGLFSKHHKDDKPKKEKKNNDHIILTSKHAAMVKTKIALDPKLHQKPDVKTAGVVGSQHTAHSNAALMEMRHPHSGPPTIKVRSAEAQKANMAALTRINSGDERDDEDDQMDRLRDAWIRSKMPGADIDKLVEQHEGVADEDIAEGEIIDAKIIEVVGTRLLGAELRPEHPRSRSHELRPKGVGWHRDEKGNWRR